tara:strand:+ start:680 stop:1402 length:723 start_codon:yes stop_codon:yes gene_type:complete
MLENKKYNVTTMKKPYPVWIIDNFLKKDVIQNIKKTWPNLDNGDWHSGYAHLGKDKNILEQGMMAISKLELMPEYLQDLFNYLYSDNFIEKIEKITNKKNLVSDNMHWSGIRCMIENSFQLIHSDARTHPTNGLRKELTCLLYLNDGYEKSRDEGCLEIWNDDVTKKEFEIEPLNNRLVIFQNSKTSHHGVPKVLSKRKSILFNYCLDEIQENGRTKALFVPREQDSDEVKEIAKKRLEV